MTRLRPPAEVERSFQGFALHEEPRSELYALLEATILQDEELRRRPARRNCCLSSVWARGETSGCSPTPQGTRAGWRGAPDNSLI
jgi:hypothetical protein